MRRRICYSFSSCLGFFFTDTVDLGFFFTYAGLCSTLGVKSCVFDFAFYKVDFSKLTGRCRPGKLVKEIGYGFDFAKFGSEMSFPKPVIKLMILVSHMTNICFSHEKKKKKKIWLLCLFSFNTIKRAKKEKYLKTKVK